jgi:Flavodoxin-like fold
VVSGLCLRSVETSQHDQNRVPGRCNRRAVGRDTAIAAGHFGTEIVKLRLLRRHAIGLGGAMAKLLYIECSPRRDNSYSAKVARAFLTRYRELHPDDDIYELELWRTNLPNLADAATDAKYAKLKRTALSAAQQEAWDEIVAAIEQFKAADKYLLSVPMWNFAIPYVLKHYIDVSEGGFHG